MNKKSMANRRASEYFVIEKGRMSAYDEQIKRYSRDLGWDWRLLASLIYQESRFQPDVKSWMGAYGLMQLMPQTADRFGVDSTSTPEEQIVAGVKFLRWIDRRLRDVIIDEDERIKFILAAYNVGYGHVLDAMRLAEKYGKDPTQWDKNVDYYVLNKSNPEYFNDPIVKHGYCRGDEPYNYVYDILERFNHYKT
ncbi:MAG: transglycosylase SLT domain-containing protein [Bacteroidales bacterium]|nr:transglycosylase SLT domain-containing protein [Bacteroidales bacterium]